MGKAEAFEGDPNDKTGQIRTLRAQLNDKADGKTVKFWIGFMGLIAAAAWAAAVYFGGFVKTDALEKTNVRLDVTNDRVGKLEAGQAAQAATSKLIEDDLHWMRKQESENAKATGARQVPPLPHDKGE